MKIIPYYKYNTLVTPCLELGEFSFKNYKKYLVILEYLWYNDNHNNFGGNEVIEMEYYIEVKNVAPLIVLTHQEPCTVENLEEKAYALYDVAKKNEKDSLFCLADQPTFTEDTEIRVCCPINSVDLAIDQNTYKMEVLPRCLVISAIHEGKYNDLKDIYKGMHQYVEKNNLTIAKPYRVIFHREKREWVRPEFFVKSAIDPKPYNEYITEIQIQVLDK